MKQLVVPDKFPPPVKRDDVASNWKSRGYDCHHFSDPPGQEWNDFVHQTNELVTVVDGQLELTVGNQTVFVQPGDEIFIPRGVTHSVRNCSNTKTSWLFGYD